MWGGRTATSLKPALQPQDGAAHALQEAAPSPDSCLPLVRSVFPRPPLSDRSPPFPNSPFLRIPEACPAWLPTSSSHLALSPAQGSAPGLPNSQPPSKPPPSPNPLLQYLKLPSQSRLDPGVPEKTLSRPPFGSGSRPQSLLARKQGQATHDSKTKAQTVLQFPRLSHTSVAISAVALQASLFLVSSNFQDPDQVFVCLLLSQGATETSGVLTYLSQ